MIAVARGNASQTLWLVKSLNEAMLSRSPPTEARIMVKFNQRRVFPL